MDMIEIINPTGVGAVKRSALAPRHYNNLAGRRIGLLDNNKPNADRFLELVGARIQERYGDVELISRRKMTRMEADGLADLAARCDAVINAFAD